MEANHPEVKPKLVVTTGTAGAIGSDIKVGDVIIGPFLSSRNLLSIWKIETPF
jgi:nucleoside phosphorylase